MDRIHAYQMVSRDEPFQKVDYSIPTLNPGEALVQVSGCGVCHTDLSFWHDGVPTRHDLPLTLGHEISGIVLDGPDEIVGKPVIVPAVLPCGECDLCKNGRSNICRQQQMPGNDFHGGFASHVVAPARFLCPVPDTMLTDYTLAELAVIADAISTPYQVIEKSGLQPGELAIVIGVGGVGIYAAQIAHARGGKVLALDISQDRLDLLSAAGITTTLNTGGLDIKEIKERTRELCREVGAPAHSWKIYEMSGTRAGQELAYTLVGIAGTLSIVGFTLDKLEVRLSNLMAFDARVIGTWGCKPELYPDVVRLVADGKVLLKPFTESFPLSHINDIFQQALAHTVSKRPVLIPDF